MDRSAQSDEAGILRHLAVWERLVFEETFSATTAAYEGRSVGDVAAERGQGPFDALLDVVVADELRTGLRLPIPESDADWQARPRYGAILGRSSAARMRRPSRHHVRSDLLDLVAGRRGAPTWLAQLEEASIS